MTSKTLCALITAAMLPLTAPPVSADEAIGAYLSARQARYENDFAAAAAVSYTHLTLPTNREV